MRISRSRRRLGGVRRFEVGEPAVDVAEPIVDVPQRLPKLSIGEFRPLEHLSARAGDQLDQADVCEVLDGSARRRSADGMRLGQLTLRRQPGARGQVAAFDLRSELRREFLGNLGGLLIGP